MRLYTVYKCKLSKSDLQVGPLHWADDEQETLCGRKIDHYWYITDNTFTGVATCKKCIEYARQFPYLGKTS
jgi:hypothetical protein